MGLTCGDVLSEGGLVLGKPRPGKVCIKGRARKPLKYYPISERYRSTAQARVNHRCYAIVR